MEEDSTGANVELIEMPDLDDHLPAFIVVWPRGDLSIVRVPDEQTARTWASQSQSVFFGDARIVPLAERTLADMGDVPIAVIEPPRESEGE